MRDNQTGTQEYQAFTGRILRSYGRKALAGELDTTALEHLAQIRAEVDAQMVATVHALRTEQGGAYSWAQIGEALGMTRAAAFKKYGAAEGEARKPGGQPAHWR
jgi:hypothetical protein